ncbi:MAG: ligase-associated DNA damage response DEXH box helicase, partial [Myxococcota bacterium]
APHPFQLEAWDAFEGGESGLIQVPTGSGKTYAAYLGALGQILESQDAGLKILYITPLRAVTRDVELALRRPVDELKLPFRVESRTGDTTQSTRAKQRKLLPDVLVTTPESLALLLTYGDGPERFRSLRSVIVDEWHELLGTKRGSLLELSLSRVRALAPDVKTWALSATLRNLDEAAQAAIGMASDPRVVRGTIERPVEVRTVLPDESERLPWAGHLGLTMLDEVLDELDPRQPTLLFTNVRSQAERWYQAIKDAKPEWADVLALHHGSLDRDERERVEGGLKTGAIRLVVCTSSLDLGVDFAPVERTVQLGSIKGIARILQRAGRSAHRPGATARVACVPTHAFELVEVAAAKRAIVLGEIEGRFPHQKPLDVLAQHLVTCSLGGGFTRASIYDEVTSAYGFRDLTEEELDWTLELVTEGGPTLRAYEEYQRVKVYEDRYIARDKKVATSHRLSIGTIVADAAIQLKYRSGRTLGTIEENFIAKLRPGEKFLFAGKSLELVELKNLDAYVKSVKGSVSYTPRWAGGKLPLSDTLSFAVRRALDDAAQGRYEGVEMERARELLQLQSETSAIPRLDEVLVEECRTKEGQHLFIYPFEGRAVHEGLAALLALRLGRRVPGTFSIAVNDYGLELLHPDDYPYASLLTDEVFDPEALAEDALQSMNVSQLAKRQFREIARVAGLIVQSYPGARRSLKQLQASSSLIFDVFDRYDPDNLLLAQARREVLEQYFEQSRLARTLERVRTSRRVLVSVANPTPLGLPLVIERVRSQLSTESIE